MNSNIYDFCKRNGIHISYSNKIFQVVHDKSNSVMFQSSEFDECLDYVREVYLNDKYSNKLRVDQYEE